jgi:hypothetical protein
MLRDAAKTVPAQKPTSRCTEAPRPPRSHHPGRGPTKNQHRPSSLQTFPRSRRACCQGPKAKGFKAAGFKTTGFKPTGFKGKLEGEAPRGGFEWRLQGDASEASREASFEASEASGFASPPIHMFMFSRVPQNRAIPARKSWESTRGSQEAMGLRPQ